MYPFPLLDINIRTCFRTCSPLTLNRRAFEIYAKYILVYQTPCMIALILGYTISLSEIIAIS